MAKLISLVMGKLLLVLLLCFSFTQSNEASSKTPLPLKEVAYLDRIKIEKLNNKKHSSQKGHINIDSNILSSNEKHQISHLDNFRLSFEAFDNTFHLHLTPTENLVPAEGATVRYTSLDPQTGQYVLSRSETIYPHDIRAYRGVVVHDDHTARRLAEDRIGFRRDLESTPFSNFNTEAGVMGTASIILHDDGFAESDNPTFEGSFEWLGNQHTIQLPLNYRKSKSEHDPNIHKRAIQDSKLVMHRFSDRMTWTEAHSLGIRTNEEAEDLGCSADSIDFNSKNALRLPSTSNSDKSSIISPFSFFDSSYESKIGRKRSFPDLFLGSFGGGEDVTLSRRAINDLPFPRSTTFSYDYNILTKRQGDMMGGNSNSSYINSIGSTTGCPNANRVVYMGVATDCTYTANFANSSAARVQVLNNMNTVSNIYRNTFKVSLGVVELDIREATNCPSAGSGDARWNQVCSDSYTLDQRLSDFSAWRGNQPANGTGLWHLLTTCLSGSEAGVAWLGTLCETDSQGSGGSTVSGTGVTVSTQNEAQTMAHEIGHNFGAVHDCISGCAISRNVARQNGGSGPVCCPQSSSGCNTNGNYIMSPVASSSTSTFSPCSIGNICSMLGQGLDTSCVVDPNENGRATLSVQQCGNGILEPGEECDAGPNGSNCCTTECRLTSGSQCDPEGTVCCNDQCQFANSTTICRPAIDDRCDTAETCTGMSADCPNDERKNNGDSCGDGLQCASGHCTSRNLQCQQQSSTTEFSFTQACSVNADNSCSISCVDPSRANTCAVLQQNFIDGTECGYGGHCSGGRCQSGSWQKTFESWYRNNLRISIPVTIVLGIVVLAILYGILKCLCLPLFGKQNGRRKPVRNSVANGGHRFSNQNQQFQPPPQHPHRGGANNNNGYYSSYNTPSSATPFRQSGGWVDPYAVNGPVGPEMSDRR